MRKKSTPAPAPITSIKGILGPVSVEFVAEIRSTTSKNAVSDAIGYYEPVHRRIQVESGQERMQTHQTVEHEWVHSVLIDTGIANLFSHDLTEAICDALGLGLALRLHAE